MLVGCGDPLVDGSYPGEPLMTLEGSVYFVGTSAFFGDDPAELRIAVFWAGGEVGEGEQQVAVDASFPAEYTLDLLKRPPASAHLEMPWARGARVAVGTPVLYYDVDEDGRWSEADTLAGGNSGLGVLHVDDAVPADLAVEAGYQRASTNSPLCDTTTGGPLAPPATASTPLFVQTPWSVFTDWDCDGELYEWQDLCPSDLDAFCDPELGGSFRGLLGWCIDQAC